MARSFASPEPTRILLIEDSRADAILIEKAILAAMPGTFLLRASSLSAALKLLVTHSFDVTLLDRSLPDSSGFNGLLSIQNISPKLPIIFLTGLKNEMVALEAVERGAQDYLFKDTADGDTIKRAINYAVHRKRFEAALITQANFDNLTGLANRVLFENRLDMALAKMQRMAGEICVFFLDLNRFKEINDTLGHAAGDKLLRDVGDRLRRPFREYDTVARFGGDEFAILIEGTHLAQDCKAIAQRTIDLLTAQPYTIDHTQVELGVSIGVTICVCGSVVSREMVMEQADQAMYQAKSSGRSAFRLYGGDTVADEALQLSSSDQQ